MNKAETENAIKVMQAYVDGKQIEFCTKRDKKWELCGDPLFNWSTFDYRISKEPQYRPFQNPLECLQEMQKHQPIGWIKYHNTYKCITSINEDSIDVSDNEGLYFTTASEIFTFPDTGEPFGIKI